MQRPKLSQFQLASIFAVTAVVALLTWLGKLSHGVLVFYPSFCCCWLILAFWAVMFWKYPADD